MGVPGLLQVLKPLVTASHISNFANRKVAVDGYSWLHKALYGCCVDICNGNETDGWIRYCLSFIDILLDNNMQVTMVFDGDTLPAKSKTELERSESRSANLAKARTLAAAGDSKLARNYYARAVDVTPQMASELIFVIRHTRPSVNCIVAPYEADAQLSYLCHIGRVDCVISEDSDNIPYGCDQVIFKLEKDGSCQTLVLRDIFVNPIDKFDLTSFNQDMIIIMCIIAGCDYLDSVKGVGLKNSHKLVAKHRTASNVLKAMRASGQLPLIPASYHVDIGSNIQLKYLQYEVDFYKAYATFYHQVVFDPLLMKTVYRTPLPAPPCEYLSVIDEVFGPMQYSFLGVLFDDNVAIDIANGKVHPTDKTILKLSSKIERVLQPPSGSSNKSFNLSAPARPRPSSVSTLGSHPIRSKLFDGYFKKLERIETAMNVPSRLIRTHSVGNYHRNNSETVVYESPVGFHYDLVDEEVVVENHELNNVHIHNTDEKLVTVNTSTREKQGNTSSAKIETETSSIHLDFGEIKASVLPRKSADSSSSKTNFQSMSRNGSLGGNYKGSTKGRKGTIAHYFTPVTNASSNFVTSGTGSSSARTTQELGSDMEHEWGEEEASFVCRMEAAMTKISPTVSSSVGLCRKRLPPRSSISHYFASKVKRHSVEEECPHQQTNIISKTVEVIDLYSESDSDNTSNPSNSDSPCEISNISREHSCKLLPHKGLLDESDLMIYNYDNCLAPPITKPLIERLKEGTQTQNVTKPENPFQRFAN